FALARMDAWVEALSPLPSGTRAARRPASASGRTLARFHVAGFRYYAGTTLIHTIRPGDRLTLVPEPANPHDRLAIRIEYRGIKIGYVPRGENAAICTRLRQGRRVAGRVVAVRPEEQPWKMLALE